MECLALSKYLILQFSRSVMSNSLWPHGLQHAKPPFPSPTPGVYPKSCSLSQWFHLTTSSSVIPFSSCPQSFPALGSFPMSQLFASGGQSIETSASTSVLQMNIQDWFPLECTGLISCSPRNSQESLQHHSSKASILQHSAFFMLQLSYPCMTTGKMIALTRWTFVGKVMSVFFKVFHSFLSKEQVSFNFMAAVTICTDFGAQENKVVTVSTVSPIYLPWSNDTGCHDLHFWMLNFKSAFSLSSFILIKSLFSSSSLSAIRVVSSAYPK